MMRRALESLRPLAVPWPEGPRLTIAGALAGLVQLVGLGSREVSASGLYLPEALWLAVVGPPAL